MLCSPVTPSARPTDLTGGVHCPPAPPVSMGLATVPFLVDRRSGGMEQRL